MANEKFILDLSNYKDRVGQRVPEGQYKVMVDDAEVAKTKNGDPMINVWYKITVGDQKGATLADRFVLTERAMFRIVQFMRAIGMQAPNKRLELSTNQFKGRKLEVEVADGDPYNGRINSEVRAYVKLANQSAQTEEDLSEDDENDDSDEVETTEAQGENPWEDTQEEAPQPAKKKKTKVVEEVEDDDEDVDLDDIDDDLG